MRRVLLLSSLTTGRCFALAEPPDDYDPDDQDAKKTMLKRSVLQPDQVWKVTGPADEDGVPTQSALGEDMAMPGDTKVVEIPRQGFDRLVARAAEADGDEA